MKKQRVFLDENKIIGLDGRRRFCVDLNDVEEILLAWHGEPYDWPEQFSVFLMPVSFFLIGPEVENCVSIAEEIRFSKPALPIEEVFFDWAIRWRLRHKGWGLRLFPTPGFGIFPLKYLPKYEIKRG